ncbi:MAG: N-acetylmuramidase domain-containing protein [Parvibaculum sp.]
MEEKLKNILKEFAEQYHFNWKIVYAILLKESNASGFYKNGLIKKRFEEHIYNGFLKVYEGEGLKHPSLPGLKREWILAHTKVQLEFLSTSFGIAQIMGYWYSLLNYKSVNDMIVGWVDSEEIQIRDFCLFCVKYNDGKFLEALQESNYHPSLTEIARQYNGSGYKKNNYDADLVKFIGEIK